MEEEKDPKEEEKDSKEERSKRSFSKYIILGVLVMVLGVGGFLGWNIFF